MSIVMEEEIKRWTAKNTVQRIFQLKGWQVRKRAVGFRPRIEALPSVATAPDQRWSTRSSSRRTARSRTA